MNLLTFGKQESFAAWMKRTTVETEMELHASDILRAMRNEPDEQKREQYKAMFDELRALSSKDYPNWLVKNGGTL